MGESIEEGTISAVLKQEGDSVEMDEAIFQIETDKVTVDVRAPEAGVLSKVLVSMTCMHDCYGASGHAELSLTESMEMRLQVGSQVKVEDTVRVGQELGDVGAGSGKSRYVY